MRRLALLPIGLLLHCGTSGRGDHPGPGGATDGGAPGPNGGSAGDGGYVNTGPSFNSGCSGAATTIEGTIFAPNGLDPIANAFAYVPVSVGNFPAGVSCDLCGAPIDGAAATATTAANGSFKLDIGLLPPTSQVRFTVNKGRFRRSMMVSVTPCQANHIGAPFTVLPGKAAPGVDDIPRIAVSTGVKDQLDVVLTAMGLDKDVGFDCFENRPSTSQALTSPCGLKLGKSGAQLTDLLKDEAKLDQYNLLFISCARGKYITIPAADQATVAADLKNWAGKGGRVFATDNAYDYIAQAFPGDVAFWNGDTTIDAANVGVGSVQNPATYMGKINDPTLAAWMTAVSALPSGSTSIALTGYLTQWSAVQSVPMTTFDVVDATDAQVTIMGATMTGLYPQTIKFDVKPAGAAQACGRAIFSSYHTLGATQMVDATMLTPQERILEYLMFEAGACVGPIM